MTEIFAAVLAAIAAAAAAYFLQPGRRALGIRRYAQLLNDLPPGSKQRKPLRNEVDRMVEDELAQRRFNEVMQFVWLVFGVTVAATLTTVVAVSAGGVWWFPASMFWLLAASAVVVFVRGLLVQRRRSG